MRESHRPIYRAPMTFPRTLAAGVVLAALALTGCGDADPTPQPAAAAQPETFRVTGQLTLDGPGTFTWESEANPVCTGLGGYEDVKPGAQVVVTDAAGATVGVGRLDQGLASYMTVGGETRGTDCKFLFEVPNVPAGKGFYGVAVSDRDGVKFTEDQVRYDTLQLTLS